MKRILCTVAITMLLIFAGGVIWYRHSRISSIVKEPSIVVVPEGWKEYVNIRRSYSIWYPGDWEVEDTTWETPIPGTGIVSRTVFRPSGTREPLWEIIVVDSHIQTIDKLIGRVGDRLQDQGKSDLRIRRDRVFINGVLATRALFTMPQIPTWFDILYFECDGLIFSIGGPQFEQSHKSFTLSC